MVLLPLAPDADAMGSIGKSNGVKKGLRGDDDEVSRLPPKPDPSDIIGVVEEGVGTPLE